MAGKKKITIGGASGYWGETPMALPQFLNSQKKVNYIVFDYLAEITMSLMARAKTKDQDKGYAPDFITNVLKPYIQQIAAQNIKLITNAGGINPRACGKATQKIIDELGLNLKVAIITGDDLYPHLNDIVETSPKEMFTGQEVPELGKVASVNAYLGAFPIAKALHAGADIVITGRCVDSAVTLGIGIYEFGWNAEEHDLLASGSLAGHILECGTQATGGNFTDWQDINEYENIGYPILDLFSDGSCLVTKPENTGGLVNVATVSEQMLYEIGDPQAYFLPDVICDFSQVKITQTAENQVHISPAKGSAAPCHYKTSMTYREGYRIGVFSNFYGRDANKKAEKFAQAALIRIQKRLTELGLSPFTETNIEIIGAQSQYGTFADNVDYREVILKIAAKHPEETALMLLLKEISGMALAAPPGLSGFAGTRPKPSPVIRLFSYLTPKEDVNISIELDGAVHNFSDKAGKVFDMQTIIRPVEPKITEKAEMILVPLIKLAWGRSGDKGNKSNIGIIARKKSYLPYIWHDLTESIIAKRLAHFIQGDIKIEEKIQRFLLPASYAINFLIDDALGGGGVASLHSDPQGKGYAQLILEQNIAIPHSIIKGNK